MKTQFFALFSALTVFLSGCTTGTAPKAALEPDGSMELRYAQEFTADYYPDGSALVTIGGEQRYLVVPQGAEPDTALAENATVLYQGAGNLYVAASSAVDLFLALGALDSVTMTSTTAENWSIPEIRSAVEEEKILYVGKYSAPDYEVVLDGECGGCIESTMIYHSPEVKEQLEQLGIPVLVERSSYEPHPLGRLEWVKLYGLLTGRAEEAEQYFERQEKAFQAAQSGEPTGKTAAFFYLTSAGAVNVRKGSDYIVRLMELAGGAYVFSDLDPEGNALSTVNLQMEEFYARAKDADVLIYNATIDGGVESIAELVEKNPLFGQFKAVQEGRVWCTQQNLFQQTTAVSPLLEDFRSVFEEETPRDGQFLKHLK